MPGAPKQREGRGAAEKLRAMETYKVIEKSLPIMLASVQQQC